MSKVDDYRLALRELDDWDAFLLRESGLPGPRGNLELAQAVAEEGDEALFARYLLLDAGQAPTNSPYEFLAFCGVLGQGKALAQGKKGVLETLRRCASDPRWRTREAVAMALQWWGRVDMAGLLQEMLPWSQGSRLEQRAAAAALCEPVLLREAAQVEQVLLVYNDYTYLEALARLADLTRVQWVSPTVTRMLVEAAYDSASKVAAADAEGLYEALVRVNDGDRFFKGKISLRDIKRLIQAASYILC